MTLEFIIFITCAIVQTKAPDYISSTEKYRKWLMPSDPSTNQKNAIEKHHLDTGLWLLEHSMYKDWKQKPNSFMWIHGICEEISMGSVC